MTPVIKVSRASVAGTSAISPASGLIKGVAVTTPTAWWHDPPATHPKGAPQGDPASRRTAWRPTSGGTWLHRLLGEAVVVTSGQERVVLVTGASRRVAIGAAIARRLVG